MPKPKDATVLLVKTAPEAHASAAPVTKGTIFWENGVMMPPYKADGAIGSFAGVLFFLKTHAQQRHGASAEHLFGRGAEQDALQVGASPGPHDNQIGVLRYNNMD